MAGGFDDQKSVGPPPPPLTGNAGEIVAAGAMDSELFVTFLFPANLLDYTVDDKNDQLFEASMTEPVKFAEK